MAGSPAVNEEMSKNLLKQAFDLWVKPEIERRQRSGLIQKEFSLIAAQVVMNVDSPIEVRLNEQVKAIMRARIRRTVTKGELIRSNDLSEIHSIELTEQDPNAGHLTIILHEGKWFISFDFQYNAQRIAEHLAAAKEFLDTSSGCLRGKRYRAFYENLFAATELVAKSWLLRMPLPDLVKKTKHGYIRSGFNSHSKLGNVRKDHAQLYNTLEEMRGPARYLRKDFQPNHGKCKNLLATARHMFKLVSKSAPLRKRPVEH